MVENGTNSGPALEVTDSLGRRWPIKKAIKAMDQRLVRRFSLAFDPDRAQASFEAYCKKHFIEHGKHFHPGEATKARAVPAKFAKPVLSLVAPAVDPIALAQAFTVNMQLTLQGLESVKSNMQSMDIDALRDLTHLVNKMMSGCKDIERLQLQCMSAQDYESVLEDEMECNGVRAALSVGNYFLDSAHLTESKRLAVARWLSECAQDEFDRVLGAIAAAHKIRMEAKVMVTGPDWTQAVLHIEDDRRWIALTRKPFDFNVIIRMIMGVLGGKGLSTQTAAKECAALLLPMDPIDMSQGVLAMAVQKLKASAGKQQSQAGKI